jgi:hypothetical protein
MLGGEARRPEALPWAGRLAGKESGGQPAATATPLRSWARHADLGAFDDALERVAAGAAWRLELVGEAGIGKSPLLAELGRRAELRGYLALDGARGRI